MAVIIKLDPAGDTPKVIEDKVRALPANQGKNESDMWTLIDAEVAQVQAAGKLRPVEHYNPLNKHGK